MINYSKADWDEFLIPYVHAASEISHKFRVLAKSFASMGMNSPIERVEHRVKRVQSIFTKAERKKIPFDRICEEMQDIAGVRIICRFVDDVDKVIELIKARCGLDMEWVEERDYVKNMKKSGYRGYHCIVKYKAMTPCGVKEVLCEIQLRTPAMDQWAKAEHSLRYKYNHRIPDNILIELIKSADAAFAQDEKMNKIRNEILLAEDLKKCNET